MRGLTKRSGKSWVVVVAAAIVIAVVTFFIWKSSPTPSQEAPPPTLEAAKRIILASSTLEKRENSPLKIVPQESLPSSLRLLVPEEATLVAIKEGEANDGKKTYRIGFKEEKMLSDAHRAVFSQITNKARFTVIRSARTNVFSMIEAETDLYAMRANLTAQASSTEVVIEVLQK